MATYTDLNIVEMLGLPSLSSSWASQAWYVHPKMYQLLTWKASYEAASSTFLLLIDKDCSSFSSKTAPTTWLALVASDKASVVPLWLT